MFRRFFRRARLGHDKSRDIRETPMPSPQKNSIPACLCAFALLTAIPASLAVAAPPGAAAEESPAYIVEVSDVTAAVGAHEVMRATLRLRDGYRILQAYNNRVTTLSSLDDAVAFDSPVVRATVEDGALVFAVGVRPTKPGKHPINGIFRVGYIHGDGEMSMVSLKLISTVTGTEQRN
jgi:hypothetical protein